MSDARPSKCLEILSITVAAADLLLFIVLKTYALKWDAGDEWIYDYGALLIAQGKLPYRDFFLAHPPLGHLLAAVVFKTLGFSVFTAKILPVGSAIASALLVFFVTRKISGLPAAALALLLLLFSHDWLRVTSHFTGANLATALMTGAVALRVWKKPATSGVVAVLACFTRYYVGLIGLVLLVEQVLSNRTAGARMIKGMAIASVVMLLLIIAGGNFSTFPGQTILYHVRKVTAAETDVSNILSGVLIYNVWIISLGALGAALAAHTFLTARIGRHPLPDGARLLGKLFAPMIALNLFTLVLLATPRFYVFYSIPLFPILAITGGNLLTEILRRAEGKKWKTVTAALAILLLVIGFRTALFGNLPYERSNSGQEKFYTWLPSPLLPAGVDAVVRDAFFENPRVIGHQYNYITHYLWHESRFWESAEEMAGIVERETSPDDTIFGDSTTTPLIALLAERRIAGDEIDTNYQRFASLTTDLGELLRSLEATDPPKILITQPRAGIDALPEFQRYRDENFREIASFADNSTGKSFAVWKRNDQ